MNNVVIYAGPTIAHVINEGTALQGGYPPKVMEEIARTPYLEELMIPIEQIAQARKEIRNPESALGTLYRRAEKGGK